MYGFVVAVSIVVGLSGCSKDGGTTPTETGSITGGMQLWDKYADVVTDESNVVVTALGSKGIPYADTTGADGKWEVKGLPADVYTLTASHPVYTVSSMLTGVFTNLQFVGVGTYKLQDLGLEAPREHDLNKVIDLSIGWDYDSTYVSHPPAHYRVDSTRFMRLKLESAISGPSNISYKIAVTETADAPCNTSLVSNSHAQRVREGNTVTFDFSAVYAALLKLYPNGLTGRTFYILIRPEWTIRDPYTFAMHEQCLPPFVVPVTF